MTQEPKGVKVWVSVQVSGKVVQLNLGLYDLEKIYNLILNRGYRGDCEVTNALVLALGYSAKVEQFMRGEEKSKGLQFGELLWVWIAARLEEVSCV